MKTPTVIALLASFLVLFGQAQVPTNQKTIKDRGEYDAYVAALNTSDPGRRAAKLEEFVKEYPQSVVLVDALEQAMQAYQQAGNSAKVTDTAKRILATDSINVRALAIVTFIGREKATPGTLKETCDYARAGLHSLEKWSKPAGLDDTQFTKLKNQMTVIFNGAAGFCALQSKDYFGARPYYVRSLQVDPNNLQDAYQLSLVYLETNPIDLNGFWYAGKAINLARAGNNSTAAREMTTYARAKYRRFHGNDEGFDACIASTATQAAPPGKHN